MPKTDETVIINATVCGSEYPQTDLFLNKGLSKLLIIKPTDATEMVNNRLIENVSKAICFSCQR